MVGFGVKSPESEEQLKSLGLRFQGFGSGVSDSGFRGGGTAPYERGNSELHI